MYTFFFPNLPKEDTDDAITTYYIRNPHDRSRGAACYDTTGSRISDDDDDD